MGLLFSITPGISNEPLKIAWWIFALCILLIHKCAAHILELETAADRYMLASISIVLLFGKRHHYCCLALPEVLVI